MSDLTTRFKSSVIVPPLLAPVLGGAILYYPLRRSLPELAKLANRTSFIGFVLWLIVVGVLNNSTSDVAFTALQWVGPVTFVFGVFHAIVVLRRIKKAQRGGDLPETVARER